MAFNYSPKVITDGLVLYLDAANPNSYPGSGTTWSDISRGGNNGTLVNGPTYSSANGGSIVFDGVDDVGHIGNGDDYLYPYHTFEVWVNTSASGGGVRDGLICLDYGRTFSLTSTGNVNYNITATISGSNISLFNSTTFGINLFDGKWHHVVALRNTSVFEIYVDGLLKSSGSNGGYPEWDGSNYWDGMTSLIANNPNNVNYNLNGKLAVVKIYNRALSSTEVLQNYNATKTRFGLT